MATNSCDVYCRRRSREIGRNKSLRNWQKLEQNFDDLLCRNHGLHWLHTLRNFNRQRKCASQVSYSIISTNKPFPTVIAAYVMNFPTAAGDGAETNQIQGFRKQPQNRGIKLSSNRHNQAKPSITNNPMREGGDMQNNKATQNTLSCTWK